MKTLSNVVPGNCFKSKNGYSFQIADVADSITFIDVFDELGCYLYSDQRDTYYLEAVIKAGEYSKVQQNECCRPIDFA